MTKTIEMFPKFLILTGEKFSGKDTFAKAVMDIHSDIKRLSFSDIHKKMCQNIFGEENLALDYQPEEKAIPLSGWTTYSPREIWEGMDIVHEIYPQLLPNMMKEKLISILNSGNNYIITDLRKPSEYRMLLETFSPNGDMFGCKMEIHRIERYERLVETAKPEMAISSFEVSKLHTNYIDKESIDRFVKVAEEFFYHV